MLMSCCIVFKLACMNSMAVSRNWTLSRVMNLLANAPVSVSGGAFCGSFDKVKHRKREGIRLLCGR